jgi:glutamyl-tRNA synthetase
MSQVRVRFAPSPTGGLHLGGVRTVLYNYLFAKKNDGKFIVRIEDTDQSRFVPGAEQYIFDCLSWCGLTPDESPLHGGIFEPYRQSERKQAGIYQQYADKLVADGHAYLAFDTSEELEQMRNEYKTAENASPQYDAHVRMKMKNSLSLMPSEVEAKIKAGEKYVVRIKMPENEIVSFEDMIRGEIKNETSLVDDKVILKSDGMPTYHLAVVVDDYLMKITHAFRGEEWLPSAPVHVLLWKYLFGLDEMPKWAHLPLILGPSGKLSKRDGAKYGFPVFAKNWTDPNTKELTEGFVEKGFLPEAFVNVLALLGWNAGTEQELFSLEELIAQFSIERVHSAGAKFDYEKAKWFNQEWIKKYEPKALANAVQPFLAAQGLVVEKDDAQFIHIVQLVKERCVLLTDFYQQLSYFYAAPAVIDTESIAPKWTAEKAAFFTEFISKIDELPSFEAVAIEEAFKNLATEKAIKPGELQLPMRIMLVGGKFGPTVFDIANIIGKEQTKQRINFGLQQLA